MPEGRSFCHDTGVKSPICLELSELFSGFRNQVVLSVNQTAKSIRKNP